MNRVYVSNSIALPLLETGISRFDEEPKNMEALLKYMLSTLNASGVSLNSDVKAGIYGNEKDIPLFKYRNLLDI